jgi:2'-5' RNA ligase
VTARIRAFLAVVPDRQALAEVARGMRALARPIEQAGLEVGWVREPGLHITVKFFGNIEVEAIPAISAALGPLQLAAPAIGLRSFGAFPSLLRPRVLFAGVTGAEALSVLYEKVERAMMELGHPPEDRPYHPHVTIGRVRSVRDRAAGERLARILEPYKEHVFGAPQPVRELILFESRQATGGMEYVPRLTISLGRS